MGNKRLIKTFFLCFFSVTFIVSLPFVIFSFNPIFFNNITLFLIILISALSILFLTIDYFIKKTSLITFITEFAATLGIGSAFLLLIEAYLNINVVPIKYYGFLTVIFYFSILFTLYLNRKHADKATDYIQKKIQCFIPKQKNTAERGNISFLENVIDKINYLPRWFKLQGTTYTIIILGILLASIYIRLRLAGSLFFWVDEATSATIAQRIASGLGQTYTNGQFYGRALLYHHYAGLLIKFFHISPYWLLRIGNTPFYIAIFFSVYIYTKRLTNKYLALIAVIIFSFSWISISIFREARFYEMWLAFFFPFIMILSNLIKEYAICREGTIFFLKKNLKTLFLLSVLFAISLDSQELTFLTLYPLTVFGIYIFLRNNNKKGLIISFLSFFAIVAALIFKKQFTSISTLIFFNGGPTIRSIYSKTPVLAVWNNLYNGDYQYLLIVVILISTCFLIFKKRIELAFISIFIFVWYFIVALQGNDSKSIRYFYPLLPLLSLQMVFCINFCLQVFKKNLLGRVATYCFIILIIVTSIKNGLTESESIKYHNSKNLFKNETFELGLRYIKSNINLDKSTIVSTNIWTAPYYIYLGKMPDYIVFDTKLIPFDIGKIDPISAKNEIDYSELENLKKPIYLIFNHPSQRISDETVGYIESIGKEIFRDGNVTIYQIN